jgi:hypothetical protein
MLSWGQSEDGRNVHFVRFGRQMKQLNVFYRHAGLDPASAFFPCAAKASGSRLKAGMTVRQ